MKTQIIRFSCFFWLWIISATSAFGQQFPISVNTILTTPSLPYLEDFIKQQPSSLMIQAILTDPIASSFEIGFRLTISGGGISIISDPTYFGESYVLESGVPLFLTGFDLADYFDPDNLVFAGITKEQYISNGRLPEGYYSVCFEAYDFSNPGSLAVSNNGCGQGTVEDFDPPILINPHTTLPYSDLNYYIFQWQALHPISIPVTYYLDIYEQIDGLSDAQIIEYENPAASFTIDQLTSYVTTLSDPILQYDKHYLARLQVIDPSEKHAFKNQGYSAIYHFTFEEGESNCLIGQSCDDADPCTYNDQIQANCSCHGTPIGDTDSDGICDLQDLCEGEDDTIDENEDGVPDCLGDCDSIDPATATEALDITDNSFIAVWQSDTPCATNFLIELALDSNFVTVVDSFWASSPFLRELTISNIQLDEQDYYYRVHLQSGIRRILAEDHVQVTRGPCRPIDQEDNEYTCGILDSTQFSSDQLLVELPAGSMIFASDLYVEIEQIQGIGTFNGRASYKPLPDKPAQVNLDFFDIKVNEDCQMIDGYMQVSGFGLEIITPEIAALLDQIIAGIDMTLDALDVYEAVTNAINQVLNETEGINDYLTDDWDITDGIGPIIDEYPYLDQDIIDALQDALDCFLNPINIEDCTTELIDALEDLQDAIEELFGADYQVNFEEINSDNWGFDQFRYPGTELLYDQVSIAGAPYSIAWKSVPSDGRSAKVLVTRTNENTLLPETRFEQNRPPPQILATTSQSENSAHLSFSGTQHNEKHPIYAYQQIDDSIKIAGKLEVVSYDEIDLHIHFVEVNDATLPSVSFEDSLQAILKSAIVHVELHPTQKVNYEQDILNDVETGFLQQYTSQMKDLIDLVPQAIENHIYIFIVPDIEDPSMRGYMPRGRQFGFVFLDNHLQSGNLQVRELIKTIAHETAHGAYKLKHTEDYFPELEGVATNFLMGNSPNGTHLAYYDWHKIHYPDSDISLFDEDEEGELVVEYEFQDAEIQDPVTYSTPNTLLRDNYFFTQYRERIKFSEEQIQQISGIKYRDENPKQLEYIETLSGGKCKIVRSTKIVDGSRVETEDIYFLCYENLEAEIGNIIKPGGKPLEKDSSIYQGEKIAYWKYVYFDNQNYAFKIEEKEFCAIDSLVLIKSANGYELTSLTPQDCNSPVGGGGNGASGEYVIDFTSQFNPTAVQRAIDRLQKTEENTNTKPRIYIFDQGTSVEELNQIELFVAQMEEHSMIVTIEIMEDGSFERTFHFGNGITQHPDNLVAAIGGSAKEITLGSLDLLTDLLDGMSFLIGYLEIPEKYYNPESKDPVTKENNFNPILRDIMSLFTLEYVLDELGIPENALAQACGDDFGCEFAMIAGIYNGMVGLVKGLPEFASLLVKLITNEEFNDPNGNSTTYRIFFKEAWNEFKTECDSVPWHSCIWGELQGLVVKAHTKDNVELLYYQFGKDMTNLASFVVAFVKVGQLSRINNLLQALDASNYVFQGAGKLVRFAIIGATHTYHFGRLSTGLILKVSSVGGKAVFKIVKEEIENAVDNTVKSFLRQNPSYEFAVVEDMLILGMKSTDGHNIKTILKEAEEELTDSYGNFLVEMKKTGERTKLGIAGKFKISKFDELVDHHQGNQEIVDALEGLTVKQKVSLDNDLISSSDLDNYLKGLTGDGGVRAWGILDDAGRNALKLNTDVLAKVRTILDNQKLDDFLPINTPTRNITTREEMVQQIVNLQGDASTIVGSRMSAMGDLMDEVDHFLANFADKPGAFVFIKELTESGGKMAGGGFILKAIKNYPDELGTIVKFETTVSSGADDIGDVVVDVITSKGSISNIFNEFKNWQTIPSNRYSSFTTQFSGYITSKNFGEFFYNFKKGVGNNGFLDISSLKSDVISAFSSNTGRAELSNIPLSRIKTILNNDFIDEAGKIQALIDHLDDIDNFVDVFKLLD